jgi:hypothetical protein
MLRKLILTETEKKQISSLHHLINEEDGFATLQGYVKYKTTKVPNSQVKLFQNEKIIKGATSDENGFFKIENISLGKYTYKVTNKVEGYEDVEEEVDLTEPKVYNVNYFFRDDQIIQDVVVKSPKIFTIIDVQVLDDENEPVPSCVIKIFDKDGKSVKFSPNKTDSSGILELISISSDTPNFELKGKYGKTKIIVSATYGNVSETKEYEIVLNNGISQETGGSESIGRIYRKDEDTEIDLRNTNKLTIILNLNLNYSLSVVDSKTDKLLQTASINLYGDKEKTDLIQNGSGEITGDLKRDQKTKKEGFENTTDVYYEVSNKDYVTQKGKLTLSKRKTNNFKISLSKVPPPPTPAPTPPSKPLSERECIRLTMKHYRNMQNVDAGNITINDLGGVDDIKKNAEVVKACYVKYMKEYPRRMEKTINRLKNVQSELDFFKLRFTNQEIRSIYGESRTMLLKNTIRKVVSESVENKSEKILIEERLKFSITGLNKKNSSEVKRALRNERYNLINFGYNKELIRESFLDVMKGLYGNDETNVLTDIKTRLGQRIADQVKNKQEEHEMILSAFNELSEEMIERAIKENRVDELSTEIATKALEIYKTQFGTEGLSGIMIASVDENKFKQEVAKLIEPAIKEITTKMDEKLKQVQDVVSGGINPTA